MKLTSVACFHQIEKEGLLSKMRLEAYRGLILHGPATSSEIVAAMTKELGHPWMPRDSYMPRLAELERLGLATIVGNRVCGVTGRLVQVWQHLDRLPRAEIAPSVPKDRDARLKAVLKENADLRAENAELRKKLGLPARKATSNQLALI